MGFGLRPLFWSLLLITPYDNLLQKSNKSAGRAGFQVWPRPQVVGLAKVRAEVEGKLKSEVEIPKGGLHKIRLKISIRST